MNTTPFDENFKQRIEDIAYSPVTREDYYHTTCDLCNVIQRILGGIYENIDKIQDDYIRTEILNIATQVDAIATVISDRTRNDDIFEMISVFSDYKTKKQQS